MVESRVGACLCIWLDDLFRLDRPASFVSRSTHHFVSRSSPATQTALHMGPPLACSLPGEHSLRLDSFWYHPLLFGGFRSWAKKTTPAGMVFFKCCCQRDSQRLVHVEYHPHLFTPHEQLRFVTAWFPCSCYVRFGSLHRWHGINHKSQVGGFHSEVCPFSCFC